MNIKGLVATVVASTIAAMPLMAAEDDAKAFGQFQEILAAIDERSFETIQKAIDKTDMRNRVYSARALEADVGAVFDGNFWQFIEERFTQKLPPSGARIKAELVDFAFQDGQGKAAVRFGMPGFMYRFQVFDLRHDSRGRLKLVDWLDYSTGQKFSADIAEDVSITMPTKAATRKAISIKNPTDLQLFQMTEIFKASRDRQPSRFFEIYDQFVDEMKKEPFVAKYAVKMAYLLQDSERFQDVLEIFVEVYSGDPNHALMMSDYYLTVQDYEKSYELLHIFQKNFSVKEGALPAKLSALALALGKPDDAEMYAVEATVDEPGLELGWWSLLRARSSAQNFEGAVEALTYLEDNFSHRLDESKLRRDKFGGFSKLVASQEFKDWRTSRN